MAVRSKNYQVKSIIDQTGSYPYIIPIENVTRIAIGNIDTTNALAFSVVTKSKTTIAGDVAAGGSYTANFDELYSITISGASTAYNVELSVLV